MALMAKEKKIGIRYYLNTQLNPQVLKGEDHFPVYVRVVYNRLNTQFFFPLLYKASYITAKEFQDFFVDRSNPEINKQIETFEDELKKIVRFEFKIKGDSFHIRGIADKLFVYHRSLVELIEKLLIVELRGFATKAAGNNKVQDLIHDAWHFPEMYYLIQNNLIPNLKENLPDKMKIRIAAFINYIAFRSQSNTENFVKAIHWIDRSHQIEFKDFLLNQDLEQVFKGERKTSPSIRLFHEYKVKPNEAPKCLAVMDQMVVDAVR